ncbi:hypothetical protein ACFU7T_08900 [Streptomyces sp. NPDC057555]|uniref:hypothetical protein n=1 Tax=Streptomyces sp. NPDC057555 TaxID=3346166 RepID=UPI003694CFBD
MHTGLKVGIFAAALAATFGIAYGVGEAVGPVAPDAPAVQHVGHAGRAHHGPGATGQREAAGDHQGMTGDHDRRR